jgi:hypothetical protein
MSAEKVVPTYDRDFFLRLPPRIQRGFCRSTCPRNYAVPVFDSFESEKPSTTVRKPLKTGEKRKYTQEDDSESPNKKLKQQVNKTLPKAVAVPKKKKPAPKKSFHPRDNLSF